MRHILPMCLALLLVIAARALAQEAEPDIIDPYTVASGSHEYTLSVSPLDRYGETGSWYQLKRRGKLVWSTRLPYTVKYPAVSDNGEVMCYRIQGRPNGNFPDPSSDLLVLRINKAGRIKTLADWPRIQDQIISYPFCSGALIDLAGNRYILQVTTHPNIESDIYHNEWWEYRLSTGARIKTLDIDKAGIESSGLGIEDSDVLPGTSNIVLVQDANMGAAAEVTLVDGSDRVVWRSPINRQANPYFGMRISVFPGLHFAVDCSERMRSYFYSYRVSKLNNRWNVHAGGRTDNPDTFNAGRYPEWRLKPLSTLHLQLPATRIDDVGVNSRGIYALEYSTQVVDQCDALGNVVSRFTPPAGLFGKDPFWFQLVLTPTGSVVLSSVSLTEDHRSCYILDSHGDGSQFCALLSNHAVTMKPHGNGWPQFIDNVDRRRDETWIRGPHGPLSYPSPGVVAFRDDRTLDRGGLNPRRFIVDFRRTDGQPIKMVDLPAGLRWPLLAVDRRRIYVVDGKRLICLGLDGCVKWTSPIRREGQPFLSSDGRTLIVWPYPGLSLDRYRMPRMPGQ